MNIKPILARLQSALGSQDLVEQMILLPEPAAATANEAKSPKSVNFVVGYNGSPNSQKALDTALWMAHQTRLATQKQVTVHVAYVLDENQRHHYPEILDLADISCSAKAQKKLESPAVCASTGSTTPVLTQPQPKALVTRSLTTPVDLFDQADRILWQARCLAEEWKGVFTAHLRFGRIATELRHVVESEAADLLLLGCNSTTHPVVQQLGAKFPCSVLGILPC